MKIIKIVVAFVLLLIITLCVIFWTPDTSFVDMRSKYGGPTSQVFEREGGERLHFRDQGLRSGRTIILVHGTSASLHTWEPLVAKLKSDFRLVSLDLPGHGLTGQNRRRDYSYAAMYHSIWDLMDHLQIGSATIAGSSLGGAVAWKAALDRAERVEALILIAPSGAPSNTEAKSNVGFKILSSRLGQALMTTITPRMLISRSLSQTTENKQIVSDAMIDRYWELLRMEGNRQAMIDLMNSPKNPDDWHRLSQISHPTLVVWGRQDRLLPVDMSVIFDDEIANSHLIHLDNVGHLPMEEAVDAVSEEILRFCSRNTC